jgi:hypothetical protein
MYSLAIFAREDAIAKDPEPLRRFLRASVKGVRISPRPSARPRWRAAMP